jgi:ComF family protein
VGKTQALRDGIDALLAVALGASCAACGELLEQPTRGPVCAICWRVIAAMASPAFEIADSIDRAQAAGPYEGALRAIIHSIKYEGRRSLAKTLAAIMRNKCPSILEGAHIVVPVPLHPSRRRERGFNQARDLALGLGLPVACALRRVRATESQIGLPAPQRRRNMVNAFAPSRAPWRTRSIGGSVTVLVDDVSTTGSTLEDCARVLREMGAREVRAITAARAVMSLR